MSERFSWSKVNHYLWQRQGFAGDGATGGSPLGDSGSRSDGANSARSDQDVWDALQEQSVQLAEAAKFASLALARCKPVTLKGGTQNLFKSPLKAMAGETIFMM